MLMSGSPNTTVTAWECVEPMLISTTPRAESRSIPMTVRHALSPSRFLVEDHSPDVKHLAQLLTTL
jgi:hypothetical protein